MAYIKEELYDKKITEEIAAHYKEILRLLGEDPQREGLIRPVIVPFGIYATCAFPMKGMTWCSQVE